MKIETKVAVALIAIVVGNGIAFNVLIDQVSALKEESNAQWNAIQRLKPETSTADVKQMMLAKYPSIISITNPEPSTIK